MLGCAVTVSLHCFTVLLFTQALYCFVTHTSVEVPKTSNVMTLWNVPWIIIDWHGCLGFISSFFVLSSVIFPHLAFFWLSGVSVCLVSAPSRSAQQEHCPTWSPVVMEHRDDAVMCTSVSMVGLVCSVCVSVFGGEAHRWSVHIESYWVWTRGQEQSLLTELQWEDRVMGACRHTNAVLHNELLEQCEHTATSSFRQLRKAHWIFV